MAAPVVTNIGSAQLKTTTGTTALTVTAAVPVGATIVISFAINPFNTNAITAADNATGGSNVYTQRVAAVQGSGTTGVRTVILTAPVLRALSVGNIITITHPSTTNIARAASAIAVTGLDNTSAFDATGTAQGSTGTTFQGQVTTVADETLVIAAVGLEGVTTDVFDIDRSYNAFARIGTTGGNANTNIAIQGGTRYFTKPNTYIHSSTGTARLYSVAMLSLKVTTGSLGPFSGQVNSTVETVDVGGTGDVADDAAIWVHPTTPANSVVIACDKDTAGNGGLYVHSMTGARLNIARSGNAFNNIDIRYNFPLGAGSIDLIGATNQTTRDLEFFSIDPSTRTLTQVGTVATGMATVYGFCLYRSTSGVYHAFVTADDLVGELKQFQLDGSSGSVTGTQVRTFNVGSLTEGLTADDAQDVVYVGEETGGVWKYSAKPNGGSTRTLMDGVGNGRLTADVEGLTIYPRADGAGYLIVTSQGSSTFAIYDRVAPNTYLGSFSVVGGAGTDLVTITDGIDVSNRPLGAGNFANGMFVAHDSTNAGGTTSNFKYVPWSSIATLGGLATDTTFDPRTPVIPERSGAVASSFGRMKSYLSNYIVTQPREFTFEFTNSFASTLPVDDAREGNVAASFNLMAATAAASRGYPDRDGDAASSFKALTATATASRDYPERSGDVVSSFKAMTADATAVRYPLRLGAVASSFGKLEANAAADRAAPAAVSGSIASSFSKLTAAAEAERIIPARSGDAASSFGKMEATASASRDAPGAISGSIASSFSKITADALAERIIPERIGAVESSFGAMSATAVAAVEAAPERSGDIAASFSKMSATCFASATQAGSTGNEFSNEFSFEFQGGVGPWEAAVESSFGKLDASAAAVRDAPGEVSGAIASSFAKMLASAAAERIVPVREGDAASSFGSMSAQATAERIIPARSGDAASGFKPLSATAAADRVIPARAGDVVSSFGALSATADADRIIPDRDGDIAASFGRIEANAAATRDAPGAVSGNVASSFKPLSATAAAERIIPARIGDVVSSFARLDATASAAREAPAAVSAAIESSFGRMEAAVAAERIIPDRTGDAASSFGQLAATASASREYPERSGAVASSFGSLSSASAANRIPPPLDASVASSFKALSAEGTAFRSSPGEVSGYIESSFGKLSASSIAVRTIPDRDADVAASFGRMGAEAQANRIPAPLSATVAASFGRVSATAAATRDAPGAVSGTVASSFGKMSAESTASRIIPDRDAAVASSFGKMGAAVAAYRIPAPLDGDINSSFKPLRATANAIRIPAPLDVDVAASFGKLSADGSAERLYPGKYGFAASSFGRLAADAEAARGYPTFNGDIAASFRRLEASATAKARPDYSSSLIGAIYLTGVIDTDVHITGIVEPDIYLTGVVDPDVHMTGIIDL